MQNNALVLAVGQTSTASPVTFLADGITPSGATYSAGVYTFNDPSATVVENSDGITAIVNALATNAAPVSGSVSFQATDVDGAVSQWDVPFTVSVTGGTVVPPTQLSQAAALIFGVPVQTVGSGSAPVATASAVRAGQSVASPAMSIADQATAAANAARKAQLR